MDKRFKKRTMYQELAEKHKDQIEDAGFKFDRYGKVIPKPNAHYGGIRSSKRRG